MIDSLIQWDKRLLLALNEDGGVFWDNFFWVMSGKLTWVPLYLFIIWLIHRRYGKMYTLWAVVFMAFGVIAADQIANIFKHGIQKFRPTHNEDIMALVHTVRGYRGGLYGTVSAHAATVFTVTTFSSGVIRSWVFTALMVLWALVVSYSRIYLGVHFPADILFGTIDGVGMGMIMLVFFRWCERRYRWSQYTS